MRWSLLGKALAALFVLMALACMGMMVPLESLLVLAVGWPYYLARVVPEVRVDPSGLATGLLCLIGFAIGTHAFLGWLYPALRSPEPARWRAKWTTEIVLTVLLMFTAGLAAAGLAHQVGWLATSPAPLVVGSQGAAKRMQSANNLKQIGLACISPQTGKLHVPGLWTATDGSRLNHSWQTQILPYLDERNPYDRIHFGFPWDAPVNAPAMGVLVRAYLIPGVDEQRDATGRALSHYEGNAKVVGRVWGFRAQDAPDGLGATILAGESAGGYRPWGEPGHWRDPADGINRAPDRGFGGPSPGGANVLFLDGSVRFLKNSIDPAVLKALGTPSGGESVHQDAY